MLSIYDKIVAWLNHQAGFYREAYSQAKAEPADDLYTGIGCQRWMKGCMTKGSVSRHEVTMKCFSSDESVAFRLEFLTFG